MTTSIKWISNNNLEVSRRYLASSKRKWKIQNRWRTWKTNWTKTDKATEKILSKIDRSINLLKYRDLKTMGMYLWGNEVAMRMSNQEERLGLDQIHGKARSIKERKTTKMILQKVWNQDNLKKVVRDLLLTQSNFKAFNRLDQVTRSPY